MLVSDLVSPLATQGELTMEEGQGRRRTYVGRGGGKDYEGEKMEAWEEEKRRGGGV